MENLYDHDSLCDVCNEHPVTRQAQYHQRQDTGMPLQLCMVCYEGEPTPAEERRPIPMDDTDGDTRTWRHGHYLIVQEPGKPLYIMTDEDGEECSDVITGTPEVLAWLQDQYIELEGLDSHEA